MLALIMYYQLILLQDIQVELSVNEFYKRISYINLSKKGIETLGPSVITLANYEGLAGHAKSVEKRIRRK